MTYSEFSLSPNIGYLAPILTSISDSSSVPMPIPKSVVLAAIISNNTALLSPPPLCHPKILHLLFPLSVHNNPNLPRLHCLLVHNNLRNKAKCKGLVLVMYKPLFLITICPVLQMPLNMHNQLSLVIVLSLSTVTDLKCGTPEVLLTNFVPSFLLYILLPLKYMPL